MSFSRSLLPHFIEKRCVRLEIEMEGHSQGKRLYNPGVESSEFTLGVEGSDFTPDVEGSEFKH